MSPASACSQALSPSELLRPLKGFPAPIQAHEVVEAFPIASRFLARSSGKGTPLALSRL
jgi:hypothetical protein